MTKRALILGAKSAIAEAVARQLSESGWDLILAARQPAALEPFAADVQLRSGQRVDLFTFDALDTDAHAALPEKLCAQCGDFQLVVLVFGYLGDQEKATSNTAEMERIMSTNYTSAAVILSYLANYLQTLDQPCGIIGIASVAGDRGRQSNYFYGSAKGALALFLQGLRNRLSPTQVHVLTVKPGFVDTPMTADMEGLFLVAPPQRVARDILRAYEKRKNVLYSPWFWRYIMLVIRSIPERVFKKLKL